MTQKQTGVIDQVPPIKGDVKELATWILHRPTLSVEELVRILEGVTYLAQIQQAGVDTAPFYREWAKAWESN